MRTSLKFQIISTWTLELYKKQIKQFVLPVGSSFCQFVDRKVAGLMTKYSLLSRDTNQGFCFFPCIKKWINSIDLSSKLSLSYKGNVNHYQIVHHPRSRLLVGIEVLWQLSKLVNNLFFEMSTQVYSLLGQAEGGRKAFSHGKSINSFHKLSLTCQRILKISKVITILAILAY